MCDRCHHTGHDIVSLSFCHIPLSLCFSCSILVMCDLVKLPVEQKVEVLCNWRQEWMGQEKGSEKAKWSVPEVDTVFRPSGRPNDRS